MGEEALRVTKPFSPPNLLSLFRDLSHNNTSKLTDASYDSQGYSCLRLYHELNDSLIHRNWKESGGMKRKKETSFPIW